MTEKTSLLRDSLLFQVPASPTKKTVIYRKKIKYKT
jgi:hypothetical protein